MLRECNAKERFLRAEEDEAKLDGDFHYKVRPHGSKFTRNLTGHFPLKISVVSWT